MTFIKIGSETASTDEFPKFMVKRKVMTLMLMICPKTRMEEAMPEACPYCGFSTDPMMVFMLGEEKRAKPIPTHNRIATIHPRGVAGVRNASKNNPREHMAMPTVAK